MQVYINCLNNFLIRSKTKIGVGLVYKKKVLDRAVLDWKSSLAEITAKLMAELCRRFWQQCRVLVRVGRSRISCFLNGLTEPLIKFLEF